MRAILRPDDTFLAQAGKTIAAKSLTRSNLSTANFYRLSEQICAVTLLAYSKLNQKEYLMKPLPFHHDCQRHAGFTLIELMVTVVIVAILASIALPAYKDYATRGKIPEATTKLSALAAQLEQYYQDNHTYVGACTADTDTIAPLPAEDDFQYSCPTLTLTATGFIAKATGITDGPMEGFTYTIDESNARKTIAVPSGWGTASADAPIDCWVTKKGGGC